MTATLDLYCINNNDNVVGGEEPPTGSLTVNKEIFGCIDNDNTDNQ